jgi:hypothetical protein
MSEWVQFKDKLPPLDWDMWISDGKSVWPGNSGVVPSQVNKEFYWRDRINPAPPYKMHYCKGNNFECKEREVKDAFQLHVIIPLNSTCNYSIITKYCPVCGFTLEKK